jgi:hypothetical protein
MGDHDGAEYAVSPKNTLTNGLVGYWTFDGPDMAGVTAFDRSGHGNNGTLTNSPARGAGKLGQALSFDGVDDFVSTSFTNGLNDFSACAWFKDLPGRSQYERIIEKDYGNGFWLGRNVDIPNSWGGGVSEGEPPYGRFITLNDGVWHLICSIRQGTTHTIVGDGGAVSTSGIVTPAPLSAGNLVFGTFDFASSWLGGLVDEVRIYNRALSADEIKRLYNMGR